MAAVTEQTGLFDVAAGLVPYRVSVEQFEAMVRSGVFTKHDRLELIDGLLVEKMTKNPPHSVASELCRRAIERVLPARWHVRSDKPIRIPGQASKPEPDLSVVTGEIADYSHQDPNPEQVALIIEVSDSSLRADRTEMAMLYARSGIPVYWIINLIDRQLEVYSNPASGAYPPPTIFRESESVTLTLGEQATGPIALAELLPERVEA